MTHQTFSRLNHVRQMSTKAERQKAALDRILRVDHAGEFGADKIYAGQMAVLGKILLHELVVHDI